MIRKLIHGVLGKRLVRRLRNFFDDRPRAVVRMFDADCERFLSYSGNAHPESRLARVSLIVMLYHVLEKGLTMPDRRSFFGKESAERLMSEISSFETSFGMADEQVEHARGVLKAYAAFISSSSEHEANVFAKQVDEFVSGCSQIETANQVHVSKSVFYAHRMAAFPDFAAARHTLRHYASKPLALDRIRAAVDLARTAPTACNRNYCRVHCIADREKMRRLLDIQGGNRGFGHLADKLLLVTVDLEGIPSAVERNDIFTNGGIFLMNLCYSLFYHEIAHCVLNWSRTPEEDIVMRGIVSIRPSEIVVALLTCGETPDEFDVALSPKIPLEDGFDVQ